ncbi:hypothetical protein [Cellulomonas shaoxiangyii]|uniref:Uncharacterized protein n=1 Tax=Cellulomonas shaoxiangyii TaxID=2566013 RepID=A0A4V1CMU5_9CELL|nr:hypothetical protein [Cellulomonas shaoxiangyii]QCB94165.1 hypothetical protein E5225_11950 [Cellulomonas shaoxiangyii]TGY86658.1 hypothetical protein E5226_00910 [Cellulomonas shaoxiangyii]
MTGWAHACAVRVQRRLLAMTDEPDRGDVPGWVLITLMTAGIVSVLWFVAGNALTELFETAIRSVTPSAG